MIFSKDITVCYVFLVIAVSLATSTISPSDKGKKSKATKEIVANSGPVDKSVFDRNLIEDEPFARDILLEHSTYFKNTSVRNFDGPLLGYVTPVSVLRSSSQIMDSR